MYAIVLSLFIQTVDEHNIVRKQYNLPEFTIDNDLMQQCKNHSIYMAKNEILVHSNIKFGAENIAQANTSPKNVTKIWMNSPGHKANILNSKYTKIGCAVYKSKNGNYYWCVRFKQ